MNTHTEAPGPLALFRKIPVSVRWWIYSAGLTLFALEGVFDAAGVGMIPEQVQGIVLGVFGLFGFTTAVANTGVVDPPPTELHPDLAPGYND